MLAFCDRVEAGALREKPLAGEKRKNQTQPTYYTPSQTVLSQLN